MRGNSKFLLVVLALTFITSSFAHIDIEQDIEGDFDIRPDVLIHIYLIINIV